MLAIVPPTEKNFEKISKIQYIKHMFLPK
jgi:hypothetical protein